MTMEKLNKVWSINEWGKLHEVILGDPSNGQIPTMNDLSQRSFDRLNPDEEKAVTPGPVPKIVIEETLEDIEILHRTLSELDITIHRAQPLKLKDNIQSPDWVAEQETAINIRDLTLIHGDLTLESASPTRGRYFEGFAVKDMFNQYYAKQQYRGYHALPRPHLLDSAYDLSLETGINETEPLFDAANCIRFGNDIIIDINNTANHAGAIWLQSMLNTYHGYNVVKIHEVRFSPDHIDVVILPLCEGYAIINPTFISRENLPDFLKNWTIITAPEMVSQTYYSGTPKASNWIGLNLLVVDGEEKTVIVDEQQLPLIHCLTQHGFRPIPVRWRHGRTWGGSFHCVSLDVHRNGEL